MKLKDGWVLTTVAGEYVAVPVGASAGEFRGVVRLNETGRDIWNGVAEGLDETAIAERILRDYTGLTPERALEDVRKIVAVLQAEGLLTE